MNPRPIKQGLPFSEQQTNEIITDFKRDGFVLIPGVLEPEEVTALREKTDYFFRRHRGRSGRVRGVDLPR